MHFVYGFLAGAAVTALGWRYGHVRLTAKLRAVEAFSRNEIRKVTNRF